MTDLIVKTPPPVTIIAKAAAPKGATGPQGPAGPAGPAGADGADGITTFTRGAAWANQDGVSLVISDIVLGSSSGTMKTVGYAS